VPSISLFSVIFSISSEFNFQETYQRSRETMTTVEKKPVSFANLGIGALLNLAEVTTLGQCFENIKTRQAAHRTENVVTATRRIYESRGLKGFWTGLIPWAWIEAGTKGAVLFFAASEIEYFCRAKLHMDKGISGILAGMGGGICQAYATMGISTTMKTAAITSTPDGKGALQNFKDILAAEGIRGVNKGVNAVAVRQATNWGLRLGIARFVEQTMQKMQSPEDRAAHKPLSFGQKILASTIGGTLGCMNQPIEVIRVEMQSKVKDASRPAKMTIANTAAHIYKSNGIRGFFTGVIPRVGLGIWQSIFMIALGDRAKQWWAQRVGGTVTKGH